MAFLADRDAERRAPPTYGPRPANGVPTIPADGRALMFIWRSGRGPRLVGCGTLLLASLVIALLIYAISGGQCTVFVFP
jgi:hypothetical protein